MTLADLTLKHWQVVAVRIPEREYDLWAWELSPHERDVLHLARESGTILTAQQRGADGVMRLLAKLARRPVRREEARAFVQQGMGMFQG